MTGKPHPGLWHPAYGHSALFASVADVWNVVASSAMIRLNPWVSQSLSASAERRADMARTGSERLPEHEPDRGALAEDAAAFARARRRVREGVLECVGGRARGGAHGAEGEEKGFVVHRAVIMPPYCAEVNAFAIISA